MVPFKKTFGVPIFFGPEVEIEVPILEGNEACKLAIAPQQEIVKR